MEAEPSAVSEFLQELPSRGYFTSAVPSSNLGGLRVYICAHDTTPPEEQLIKSDPTNILIRYLTLNTSKQKTKDRAAKQKQPQLQARPDIPKGKRIVENSDASNPPSAKKKKDASSSTGSSYEFQGYTVDKLKALLREHGLSVKGKKAELIARLKHHCK